LEVSADSVSRTELLDQAFYPLTLPLTTGPGTIAVVISLGLSRASYTSSTDEIVFVLASLAAAVAIAITAAGLECPASGFRLPQSLHNRRDNQPALPWNALRQRLPARRRDRAVDRLWPHHRRN